MKEKTASRRKTVAENHFGSNYQSLPKESRELTDCRFAAWPWVTLNPEADLGGTELLGTAADFSRKFPSGLREAAPDGISNPVIQWAQAFSRHRNLRLYSQVTPLTCLPRLENEAFPDKVRLERKMDEKPAAKARN